MARTITGPKPGGVETFTPAAFENREDESPVTGDITTPTEGEKRDIMRARGARFEFDDNGKPTASEAPKPDDWRDRALLNHLSNIKNYNGPDGPILTGADLIAHGEVEFVNEFSDRIANKASLSAGEIKN